MPDLDLQENTVVKEKLQKPRMYKVVMHNDDFTSQDFVVMILMTIFGKTEVEAYDLMMQVHRKGKGVAGIYSKEVAEHKVHECSIMAKHHEVPFLTTYEPEE